MPKCELTFNYSVTELSNVDVWDGNGLYILYQTAENRQNSHLSTHLHISTNKTGFFFFSPVEKKSGVLVLKHCTGKKFPVITPQNNCKY